jgi:hypothetical protein
MKIQSMKQKQNMLVVAILLISLSSAMANDGDKRPPNSPGHVHNILSTKLPLKLLSEVKKEYKSYWITELYVQSDNKHRSYTITVENADCIIEMKSTNSKTWLITGKKIKAV